MPPAWRQRRSGRRPPYDEADLGRLTSSSNALVMLTESLLAAVSASSPVHEHLGLGVVDGDAGGGGALVGIRYEDLVELEDVRVVASDADIRSLRIECVAEGDRACGSSCSVCLSEFAAGDSVVQLPVCGHRYHYACISRWLQKYASSCPTCRRRVFEDAPAAPAGGGL